ncbi:MAG: hypothetical protein U0175_29625 [Caldilineaceae bacterium]
MTSIPSFDMEKAPTTMLEFLVWVLVAACGWCGTALILFVGTRFLDHDSKALCYGQETLLPFFVIHQPMVLAVAYFVVQWQVNLWSKFLIVTLASFVISIGLTEWLIKRVPILRLLFGMKSGESESHSLIYVFR